MKKSDLILRISEDAGITKLQAEIALKSSTSSIAQTLLIGGKVTIVGLGTFYVTKFATKSYRHITTVKLLKRKSASMETCVVDESLKTQLVGGTNHEGQIKKQNEGKKLQWP